MRGTAVDRGRSLHRKVGGQVRVHFVLGIHSGRERTEQDWRDLVGRSGVADGESAVDDEYRAGDVRGGREKQRQRRVRNLFGIPVTT
ncbi:MAG: hypothetical protein QOG79_330 [Mycobacterium sp.]|nr:hypothetical protein [Mycobacterium sp.]